MQSIRPRKKSHANSDWTQMEAQWARIAAAADAFTAAVTPVLELIDRLGTVGLPLAQYARGGMVAGAPGQASLGLLHAGEVVINPAGPLPVSAMSATAIDAALGRVGGTGASAMTSIFQVNIPVTVTGNHILEGFDLTDLGQRLGEATLTAIRRQLPIPHPYS